MLLGFVGARTLERRLASVSDVAGLLTAGDLSRRLPQSGRGDEFDRLVMTVNAMLDKLETLVAAQRQVTDDIAHDLRGPLQRLRQGLEEALADRPDDRPWGLLSRSWTPCSKHSPRCCGSRGRRPEHGPDNCSICRRW